MPFLPLYFQLLGLSDVGEIALWSGLSLGVTPALTALLSPFWGRLADRYGRKIMVERSLFSFVIVMAAMAFVTRPWHVFAPPGRAGTVRRLRRADLDHGGRLRAARPDGVGHRHHPDRAAARARPSDRSSAASVAQLVGLRNAFLVTAVFYVIALVLVFWMYDERGVHHELVKDGAGRISFRNVLAFENFVLLMAVIFTPAVRGPQLRAGAAAVRRPSSVRPRRGCPWWRGCCSRLRPAPGRSATTCAAAC